MLVPKCDTCSKAFRYLDQGNKVERCLPCAVKGDKICPNCKKHMDPPHKTCKHCGFETVYE